MIDNQGGVAGDLFDVIIIGGGPAGLSAAIWCSDLKLTSVLFDDGEDFGGQLGWTFNPITNYPGILSIEARELRRRITEHAANGTSVLIPARVAEVDLAAKSAMLSDGGVFRSRAVIIATGVSRRRLGLPGESELLGRGVLYSGVGSKSEVAGGHVVIVGGGDAAVENALILSESASQITVVHRGEALRARREFTDAAEGRANVHVRLRSEVASILGEQRFEGVELRSEVIGPERLPADFLLVRIGTQPNTELFAGQIEMDDGFACVDADASTSTPGVYAIGDASSRIAPTLSTAIGTAAIAAKAIERELRLGRSGI
jgi:thioredoxin reductase (NADPH)